MRVLAEVGELPLQLLQALAGGLVLLLLQGLALDLELHDLPLHLVDLGGQAVDLDAQPARRFVHQVDGLVRQEAVPDVPVGQRSRRHEGAVGDADAVVHLVFFLQAPENRNGVRHTRLAHQHRLEAALERRILLHMLAVLVERGGADDVQLPPGQRRLEHVARIHGAFGRAGTDDRVQLVDEDDVAPLRLGQLLHDRLEPLLELAPVLGAREQLADVERHQLLVAERVGDVAVDDPLREAFDDGVLPHAGLTDQHRIVLGPAGQHLHHPADFLVPADYRIQLSVAGLVGEVPRVPLERLVLGFGRLVRDPVRAAHALEGRAEIVGRDVFGAQQGADGRALLLGQGEQQMLGGDVLVAHPLGFLFRPVEDAIHLAAERRLRPAGLGGEPGDLALGRLPQAGDVESRLLEQRLNHPLVLRQQGEKQVGIVDDRVAAAACRFTGVAEGFLGLDGQAVGSDHGCLVSVCGSAPRASGRSNLWARRERGKGGSCVPRKSAEMAGLR